jgi:hypothetical protein
MENEVNTKLSERIFKSRLDYYWKSLSIYAIILSLAILIQESLSNLKVVNAIYKPLIFLLIFFVIITSIALLYQIYKKKSIILNEEGIVFKYRNKSRQFNWDKIIKITFIRDKFSSKSAPQIIRIKVNKYRFFRVNPSSFENETELINYLQDIKLRYHK